MNSSLRGYVLISFVYSVSSGYGLCSPAILFLFPRWQFFVFYSFPLARFRHSLVYDLVVTYLIALIGCNRIMLLALFRTASALRAVRYHELFFIPMTYPSPAACLKQILHKSNFRMNPPLRPQMWHLFSPRTLPTPRFPVAIIFARSVLLFFAFAISDFRAMSPAVS